MSYESPIMVFSREKLTAMQDEAVCKAILEIGVKVDKNELIRALTYDRNQYDRGYLDGYNTSACQWVSVEDRLPDKRGKFLCWVKGSLVECCKILSFAPKLSDVDSTFRGEDYPGFYYLDSAYGLIEDVHVTHWMPLPNEPTTM